MRTYPTDEFDREKLDELKAEPWMVDTLKCNPDYVYWGNYEDYMCEGSGWARPNEVENVSNLWELDDLNEVVNFYFEILRKSHTCECCDGTGLNEETKKLYDSWYDYDRWCENLTQDEVDILWRKNRLRGYFKSKPTANEVNLLEKTRLIHDSLNHSICVETRAKRLGVYGLCEKCGGNGIIFDEEKAHLELQLWVLHPRKGCSCGLRIKNVLQSDVPKAIKYLKEARKRNDDRFSKIDFLEERE